MKYEALGKAVTFETKFAMEATLAQDFLFREMGEVLEARFPDLQERAVFCVKAMAFLTKLHITHVKNHGVPPIADVKAEMKSLLTNYMEDDGEVILEGDFKDILARIEGEQVIQFARVIEVDDAKLDQFYQDNMGDVAFDDGGGAAEIDDPYAVLLGENASGADAASYQLDGLCLVILSPAKQWRQDLVRVCIWFFKEE